MVVIAGVAIVLVAAIVPYVLIGGHIGVLWKPGDYATIIGAAIGTFVINTNVETLKGALSGIERAIKCPKYK